MSLTTGSPRKTARELVVGRKMLNGANEDKEVVPNASFPISIDGNHKTAALNLPDFDAFVWRLPSETQAISQVCFR